MDWKSIASYEGSYSVDEYGNVRADARTLSLPCGQTRSYKERPIKVANPTKNNPYRTVSLNLKGKSRTFAVHDLVARAFLGPRPDGSVVRHLDGNYLNNHYSNLKYGTQSENIFDSVTHGTHHYSKRSACSRGHLYETWNLTNEKNRRRCRSCSCASVRIYDHPEMKSHFDELADSYYRSFLEQNT